MDKISREKRSRIMSTIRSKNTRPEIVLRKALWARGLRYRKHYGKEKIDIAFTLERLAVFVDGCFWHGCPLHSHLPKSRRSYWIPKLTGNIVRDRQTNEQLRSAGWTVIRFWEHEMKNLDPVIDKIVAQLSPRHRRYLRDVYRSKTGRD